MNSETENIGAVWDQREWHPVRFWLKRFLAGNPFYIVSAALLLYGIYCVSMDPRFSSREIQQMVFNFGSLQVYGIVLTLTALFLARRRIWYDSTLLVVLESALVLVPFLLVSQAISLVPRTAYLICGLTVFFTAIHYSMLKRFYPGLNLPSSLLGFGAMIIAVNAALPLLFKSMQDTGTAAMALDMQEAALRLALTGVLPTLAVLAVFLPPSKEAGVLPPQKKWLPLLIHFLWIIATGVHLYSIQYVYETRYQVSFFAPTVWVLAWVLAYRLRDSITPVAAGIQKALLVLPAIIALPIVWPGRTELNGYFLLCNLVLYSVIYFRERTNRIALQLALVSLAAVFAELPKEFWPSFPIGIGVESWVLTGTAAYIVLAALTSRNPKLGLAGALTVAWGTAVLLRRSEAAFPLALQAGFGFALLHSIVWKDIEHAGAKAVRCLTAACWALHTLSWTQSHSRFSFMVPATVAAAVVIGYFAFGLLRNIWASRLLLYAAAAVLISTPVSYSVERVRTASPGVLVVIGSFILFGIGTWFALNKSKWTREKAGEYSVENTSEGPRD
jgi:hypothetical protein